MTRLSIIRNLRSTLFVLLLGGVAAAGGLAVWTNHTGLPDEWRRMIERELSKHGNHARIGSLRLDPLEGVVAEDVELFSPDDPSLGSARFQRVVVDLDVAKLLRGELRLERFELFDARVSLPTTAGSPDLVVEHLHGRVLMNAGRVIEVRDVEGMIGGVVFEFGARVLGYRPYVGEAEAEDEGRQVARRLLLARIATELERWDFDRDDPPRIRWFLEGELDHPEEMRVEMGVTAGALGTGGYMLEGLELAGEIVDGVVSLGTVKARDEVGTLDGRLDYDLQAGKGSFAGRSDLDAIRMLRAFAGVRAADDFAFANPPEIELEAKFRFPEDAPPEWNAVGHFSSGPFMFRGNGFDAGSARFSVRGRDFYVRDVELRLPSGIARGRAMVKDGKLRYEAVTNVPVDPWRPFFEGRALGRFLDKVEAMPGHTAEVNLQGSLEFADASNWTCGGKVRVTDAKYKGVPIHLFDGEIWLSGVEFRFEEALVAFDDRNYPLRKVAPSRPQGRVRELVIDRVEGIATVDGLEGTFWPGQAANLFSRELGQRLKAYRFHAPPQTSAHGAVDFRSGARSDFRAEVRGRGAADYEFIGETITVNNPVGRVWVRSGRVDVDGLGLDVCGGRVDGRLTVSGRGASSHRGEFSWSGLELPEIARYYGFKEGGGGSLTGRLSFSSGSGKVSDFDGKGLVALEDGELFEVPIFGPLSPIISGVLADRKAGFEHARDAFCSFVIRDGVLFTEDFRTETPSLVFTGTGNVGLAEKDIDMTMRLDARGLFGVITLPLRPFYGLFQFRGTGKLTAPEWRSVMFTAPGGAAGGGGRLPRARPAPPGEAEAIPKARPVDPSKPAPRSRRRVGGGRSAGGLGKP